MTDPRHPGDDDLRAIFRAQRERERDVAPSFDPCRRPRPVRRIPRAPLVTLAATLVVGTTAAWVAMHGTVPDPSASSDKAPSLLVVKKHVPPADRVEPAPASESPRRAPIGPTPAPAPPPAVAKAEPVPETSRPSAPSLTAPERQSPHDHAATGALEIRVTDAAGPLPGAQVWIAGPSQEPLATVTDAGGVATFSSLPAGDAYLAEVRFPGYSAQRIDGLSVDRNETRVTDAMLFEERIEEVVVVAEKSIAGIHVGEPSRRFSEDYVRDLPVDGRFFTNTITMAPGVDDDEGDGNPTVHGSRTREFAAVVGGVSSVDPPTGRLVQFENPDSIEEIVGTESYAPIERTSFLRVAEAPLSTFAVDVDTAAYTNVRRYLDSGVLPPRDAVRVEELINYFRYDDVAPAGDDAVAVGVEVAECPWNPDHRLARVAVVARRDDRGDLAGSNLVFLLDVSSSMGPPNKLPLVKSALRLLVDTLDGRDSVAIVAYASDASLALAPTPGSDRATILDAIDRLVADGSTSGAAGLELAYRIAVDHFVSGGVNRVILATDGDFNVGATSHAELLDRIAEGARRGVFLTALGFGMGNLKDDRLERLADRGNGQYAYVDSVDEARRLFVEQAGGTLVTVAKDVKIQVELNPVEVGAYRLIGYENRTLADRDFNDDTVDGGEIGAGHVVTALYELVPPESADLAGPEVDRLRYREPAEPSAAAGSGELLTVKVRYKLPEGSDSRLVERAAADDGTPLGAASDDLRFAAAVAAFGLKLRQDPSVATIDWPSIARLAGGALGADEHGHRAAFVGLVRQAEGLTTPAR